MVGFYKTIQSEADLPNDCGKDAILVVFQESDGTLGYYIMSRRYVREELIRQKYRPNKNREKLIAWAEVPEYNPIRTSIR